MNIDIIEKIVIKNLPSASGIEVIDKIIYIIGDDSPYLYCLNFNFQITNKIELFKSDDLSIGRIPKKIKPDLECMTKFKLDGKQHLLICGSGSNNKREKAFLVNLEENYSVYEFSLSGLFQTVKENTAITEKKVLNIEGIAVNKNNIYFFDRENSVIFFYELKIFIDYLKGKINKAPLPSFNHFKLEGLNNIKAGFSGADIFDSKLFFTTSVEDTPDPISDGKVYGSFIGYIEFDEKLKLLPMLKNYTVIREKDIIFTRKVESISVHQKINDNEYFSFIVTDDDQGGSELLKIKMTL